MLVFILGLTATGYLINAFSPKGANLQRDRKTTVALATAKSGLIGWAVKHASMPGVLPCPDTDNDGLSNATGSNCDAYIGRLPWKTIGLGPIKDGDDECLWYALSPIYRDSISVSNRNSLPLNSNTAGTLSLVDASGTLLPSPPSPAIALIIAPGTPLSGQSRTGPVSLCGGNSSSPNYLDALASVNNATGNVSGVNYTFVVAPPSTTFNDRIEPIAPEQLRQPLRRRIANEIRGGDTPPTAGLRNFYNHQHYFPWAGNFLGIQQTNLLSGFIPYNDPNYAHPTLGTWLMNNGWYGVTSYQVGTDFQPGTESTFPQTCAGGCVTARSVNVPAKITVGGGAASWTARVCMDTATMTCPAP